MGAYSSWAVFALSHHLIVRVAAMRSGSQPDWHNYALLGDDIVIAGSRTAREYKAVMTQLGVSISETKSHESLDTYEFAKRWYHSGTEISGLPLNSLLQTHTWYELATELENGLSRWSTSPR